MKKQDLSQKKSRIESVDFANLPFGKIFTDHMVVVKYSNKKWGTAEVLPYGPIEILPSISALHYGQAVFEGMKAFWATENGSVALGKAVVFRPEAHSARINKSLARLDMPAIPEDLFVGSIDKLIKEDSEWLRRAGQLYVRPFVFATTPYLGMASSEEYLFIVLACPVGQYYTKPLNLKIEKEFSRSAPGGTGFAKAAGNYAGSLYPTRLAHEAGFDQLIWTDAATHTKIEESGTMNIMCVIGGKLVTPRLSDTILSGINRDSILSLARENKIPFEERDITVIELLAGLEDGTISEIFGVGTAVTVVAVESVTSDGKKYLLPKLAPATDQASTEKSLSAFFYKRLEEIKRGKIKDSHGWVHEVAA
jgi:branched-chain amino acid aminotransferase